MSNKNLDLNEIIENVEQVDIIWGVRTVSEKFVAYVEYESYNHAKHARDMIDEAEPSSQPQLVKAFRVQSEWEFSS